MTLNKMAELVAEDFLEDMADHSFESFEEMKKCYKMDREDIIDEVNWLFNDRRKKARSKGESIVCYIYVYDDGSTVVGKDGEMAWKDFYKMFKAEVNARI